MSDATSDREFLAFKRNVEKYFCFLIVDYGFQIVLKEDTFVRYETEDVFIDFYHGRLSYEIGVECGLKCQGYDSRFRLPIILLGLLGEDAKGIKAFYQASIKESVSNCLDKIARLVQEHCASLLRGDKIAFSLVAKASSEESKFLTEKYSIYPIKSKAYEAWKIKDYEKVFLLYGSIKSSLSSIEEKRFKYASKNIQK